MTVCTDGGFVASVSTELDEVSAERTAALIPAVMALAVAGVRPEMRFLNTMLFRPGRMTFVWAGIVGFLVRVWRRGGG